MPALLNTFLRRLLLVLFVIFCCAYPFAVAGIAFDVHPPFSLDWAASGLLFLEGVLLILATVVLYGASALLAGGLVILFSYLVETLGVNSGFPFGAYHYTGILFPSLPGDVPLPVMFAWVLVIFGAWGWLGSNKVLPRSLMLALGALLAMLLDLAIEPVAAYIVHYWQWQRSAGPGYYGVPLANFAAWFCVAFILLFIVTCLLAKTVNTEGSYQRLILFMPRLLFSSSLFMFGLIDLTHGYYAGTLSALCAVVLLSWLALRHKKA